MTCSGRAAPKGKLSRPRAALLLFLSRAVYIIILIMLSAALSIMHSRVFGEAAAATASVRTRFFLTLSTGAFRKRDDNSRAHVYTASTVCSSYSSLVFFQVYVCV